MLQDGAPENLLMSYGPERSVHVQEIIRQAVGMGRIICMLDPEEVAERNMRMKAALQDPDLALKPPPEPRLGDSGAYLSHDANAGYLSVQGRVRHAGREGLLDDVVGTGWQLLLHGVASSSGLNADVKALAAKLGASVINFCDRDTIDLDGSYQGWFDRLKTVAVLVRPDFYVFGTADVDGVEALLRSACTMLAFG